MPLKNTNTLPPGGWIYEQPDNNGKIVKKFKSMSPFKEACNEILKCRQANHFNRATLQQVMEDVDEFTCKRLGFDQNFVKKKAVTFVPTKLFSPLHLRGLASRAGNLIGGAANAAVILTRWLGSGGKPVDGDTAQRRANVCLTVAQGTCCPFNEPGFKPVERIADIIRAQTEEKEKLGIKVEGEEKLHTCSLCWCDLKLKIQVPLDHILSGTPNAMLEKFKREQPKCWMLQEIEEQKTSQKT